MKIYFMRVLKTKTILLTTFACISFCLVLLSCSIKGSYGKESEFKRYLLEIHHIDIDTVQNAYFFILQMYMCGACTEESMKFIQRFSTPQPTYFILSGPNPDIETGLSRNSKHIILKIDGYTFVRYGLRSS